MIAQLHDTQPITIPIVNQSRKVTAVATLIGLSFGILFSLLGHFSTPITLGICLLSLAITFISGAFISRYSSGEPRWSLALSGQVLGVLGIGLLFLTAMVA